MIPRLIVENVSKRYASTPRLGGHYPTMREAIRQALRFRSSSASKPVQQDDWILKDVSLDAKPGEVVALLGRNGAGKSTLLKIMSRITPPTQGRIGLRGRVGSLLEVGTGFHMELTGRENIFLNGAILGLNRREVQRRLDRIVSFAEVESHLDIPVKQYSSGMYMRLAFAVAAHLEPDILLIDEVLAVGDAAFQRRCLETIRTVGDSGRIVVIVSHDLVSLVQLCQRGIWLDRQTIQEDGPIQTVLTKYLQQSLGLRGQQMLQVQSPRIQLERIWGETGSPLETTIVRRQQPLDIHLQYRVLEADRRCEAFIQIRTAEGVLAFCSQTTQPMASIGRYQSHVRIPSHLLNEGLIRISVGIYVDSHHPPELFVPDALVLQVVDDAPAYGDRLLPLPGVVRPNLDWQTIPLN